jgi:hypothetical protein
MGIETSEADSASAKPVPPKGKPLPSGVRIIALVLGSLFGAGLVAFAVLQLGQRVIPEGLGLGGFVEFLKLAVMALVAGGIGLGFILRSWSELWVSILYAGAFTFWLPLIVGEGSSWGWESALGTAAAAALIATLPTILVFGIRRQARRQPFVAP